MKIQLVTYLNSLSRKQRLINTLDILNHSHADFVLFPGHTLGFVKDIDKLRKGLENKKVNALIELQDMNSDRLRNALFLVKNGYVINLFSNQLFESSHEINNNYELGSRLINELKTRRKFKIKGKQFLILQCGELNILKNIQSKGNSIEFRLADNMELSRSFEKIIKNTNIFLNPMHTPMGNKGKMQKRRQFLSEKSRAYFSVSNTKLDGKDLKLKGLQYAYKNSNPLMEKIIDHQETYMVKEFEI